LTRAAAAIVPVPETHSIDVEPQDRQLVPRAWLPGHTAATHEEHRLIGDDDDRPPLARQLLSRPAHDELLAAELDVADIRRLAQRGEKPEFPP
jgi:hypothetical protein